MDDNVAAGSEQSFGIVHINPGKTNPAHWHTNAQEIVHMLQGECDVETDGDDDQAPRRADAVHPGRRRTTS